jgi:hypothetical protein
MSGIGWKPVLARSKRPERHGSPQLSRVAAKYLSPGPQKSISRALGRDPVPGVRNYGQTPKRLSGGGPPGPMKE